MDPSDLAHLLRRTEFIARPARVIELSTLPTATAVESVIDFAPNADPQLPAQFLVEDTLKNGDQFNAEYHWWFDQMATRPRPLQEKMTLFWHGHFVSGRSEAGRNDHMMSQNQLYRSLALGNYLELVRRMAFEPAMLKYLSNDNNVKGTPNENFARELMELFTLGVGNYEESDVAASARAWTGHNYNGTTRVYEFRPTKHDTGQKTFFGITKNWDGPDIINAILRDIPTKRAIAAKHIARKLWEFFAYSGPAQNIVDELADVFVNNNLELRPLMRALLNRPEFYSAQAKQGMVRSPTEWAVAVAAHAGLNGDALGISNVGDRMGHRLFYPPNVAGWKTNGYWLNTGSINGRAYLARRVAGKLRQNGGFDNLYSMGVAQSVDYVAAFFGMTSLGPGGPSGADRRPPGRAGVVEGQHRPGADQPADHDHAPARISHGMSAPRTVDPAVGPTALTPRAPAHLCRPQEDLRARR